MRTVRPTKEENLDKERLDEQKDLEEKELGHLYHVQPKRGYN